MLKLRTTGSKSAGSLPWFIQRVSGIVLVILLILHFALMHYPLPGDSDGYKIENVINRLDSPYWKAFDIFFLVFAIYHGMNGLWQVLQDYKMKQGFRLVLYGAIFSVGIFFLTLGTITIINFKG